MNNLKRIVLFIIVITALESMTNAAYAIDPKAAKLTDPELMRDFPAALAALDRPPATVAQRQLAESRLRFSEKFIPGFNEEDPPVRILIIEPKKAVRGRPGLLDMHGGGYTGGSPELSSVLILEKLVLKYGFTVVSVDYRLAPGTRYPGSLHDNYAALKWFHDNADKLGVDRKRIATFGVSAGGGHAAALGIFARDQGKLPILFQILLCPMLDDRTGSSVEPGSPFGNILWTRELNREGWKALLGVEPGGPYVPVAAVPSRVADLSNLPPTYISVGALDLFAMEDIAFAQRLMAAGVPTELHVFPGGFHGYELIVPNAHVSRLALKALDKAIIRGFGLGNSPLNEKARH